MSGIAGGALAGLLLAAGRARRFGANKLLTPVGQGRALGLLAAERLAALVPLQVVVRAGDEQTRELYAAAGYAVVECGDADRGMGASLAAGVRALGKTDGVIVALADMPQLSTEIVRLVCERLNSGAPIVRPRYNGRPGHPVGFAARFFAELEKLDSDDGGRPVLERHAGLVDYIDTADGGVVRDVDVPEDLEALDEL